MASDAFASLSLGEALPSRAPHPTRSGLQPARPKAISRPGGHRGPAPLPHRPVAQASEADAPVLRLPPHLLHRVLLHLDTPEEVAHAAITCRAWRSATGQEEFWKSLYHRHFVAGDDAEEEGDPFTGMPDGAGHAAARAGGWAALYRDRVARRARRAADRALARCLKARWLRPRVVAAHCGPQRRGGNAAPAGPLDATTEPGSLQKAIAHLDLTFYISVNSGSPTAPAQKSGICPHPLATSVRAPPPLVEGLAFRHLARVDVACHSGALGRRISAAEVAGLGDANGWGWVAGGGGVEIFARGGLGGGGSSAVLGLFSEGGGGEGSPPRPAQEVAFLQVNVHHLDLVRRAFAAPVHVAAQHAPQHDDIDPRYGLHGYTLAVTLRSHRRLLWHEHFRDLYAPAPPPGDRRSPGAAVLVAVSPADPGAQAAFPGTPQLAWESPAFSGTVGGVGVVEAVLWDEHGEPAWLWSGAVAFRPAADGGVAASHGPDGRFGAGFGFDAPSFLEAEGDGGGGAAGGGGPELLCASAADPARGVRLELSVRCPPPAARGPRGGARGREGSSRVEAAALYLEPRFLSAWFGACNLRGGGP